LFAGFFVDIAVHGAQPSYLKASLIKEAYRHPGHPVHQRHIEFQICRSKLCRSSPGNEESASTAALEHDAITLKPPSCSQALFEHDPENRQPALLPMLL